MTEEKEALVRPQRYRSGRSVSPQPEGNLTLQRVGSVSECTPLARFITSPGGHRQAVCRGVVHAAHHTRLQIVSRENEARSILGQSDSGTGNDLLD